MFFTGPAVLSIIGLVVWFANRRIKRELSTALERFQGTFENAAIGMAHVAPDGRFLLVNRELCRITAYSREELLEMNIDDLDHREDTGQTLAAILSLTNGERESCYIQKRYLKRDGRVIWVELTKSVVRDRHGKASYFVDASRDITEQKQAELKLAQTLQTLGERERQLQMLFEQGGLGDFTYNIKEDQVTAHPMVWELYGAPDECGPKPAAWFEQRQHPEDLPLINAHMAHVFATADARMDLEFRVVRPDGSIRWISCRGTVRRDDGGKPTKVYGLNIDISRLKFAEEELRQSERGLIALTDIVPQLVWFTDASGNAEFFNQRWYDYTGQATANSLHWGWQPAIHPADLPDLIARWTHAVTTGCPHEAEFRIRAKDGTYRWFLGRGRPHLDKNGKILRWFGTCTDIEERKSLEVRLLHFGQEMERQVAERTRDLETVNKELALKNQEVEAFVYIVSHDLRAPLVNLQGFARELEMSCDELREKLEGQESVQTILNSDIPSSLRYISASTSKFSRLIHALLDLSRYGRVSYHAEDLELNELVQSSVDLIRLSIAAGGVQVRVGEMPRVNGDATALGQTQIGAFADDFGPYVDAVDA